MTYTMFSCNDLCIVLASYLELTPPNGTSVVYNRKQSWLYYQVKDHLSDADVA